MALTAQEVQSFLLANPGLSDAQIASLANQYGVSAQTLSEATGVPVTQVTQRAEAAGTPLTGMITGAAPTQPAPTAQPTSVAQTPERVLPADVRAAFESQNLTMDQYNTLSRYFGNPLLMDEATRDPNQPTIKEYVDNGRSGYEFATFAATRVPRYGGQLGTGSESEQLGKLGALVAPYIGASAGDIIRDSEGGLSVNGPGGTPIPLQPTGQPNKYIANIGRPLYGEAKTRYNVGIEYTLDPQTDELRISNPSIQAFQTTSSGNIIKQAIGIIAPFALNALFPGLGNAIGSFLAPSLSGVAQAAIGNAAIAGLSTGAITGDVEKGVIAAALVGGGSYLSNSGVLGDIMDSVGLGDFRTQFNVPTTNQVAGTIPGIEGFGAAADQVGGALTGVSPVTPGGPVTTTPIAPTTPSGLFGTPTGPAGFQGIDLSTQLANQATGGLTAGAPVPVGTGGFGTALPSVDSLTQSLIGAGFSPGTAANLAGATLAGAGGVGAAATGLLGTGGTVTTPTAPTTTTPTTPSLGQVAQNAGGLLSGLGNMNIGGVLGAGIDFAQLAALQREATGLGRELGAEAAAIGRQGAIPFTPYTVTTGAGVGTVRPGEATAVTSPEMQALRQQQLGLAGQAFGAVNPAQAAQTLYGQAEALAAPGRAREQEALLAGLRQRGLLGFGQNLPTVGGGIRTVNPLMESLLSAQETARAQQALQAQQLGTQEATRQAALGQGLVGGAQAIDRQALEALTAASNLGQQERAIASRNALLQAEAGLQGLRMRSPYEQLGLQARGTALAGVGGATRGLFGLPTQQGNVLGNLTLGQLFGGGTATSPLGEGTGPAYGFQDYGQFFGGNYIL
jgi:hypothetical protein